MTSFTAASGPLDKTRQARDLAEDAADRLWDIARKLWVADESLSALAAIAADTCAGAENALTTAIRVLEALDRIILAEDQPGVGDE